MPRQVAYLILAALLLPQVTTSVVAAPKVGSKANDVQYFLYRQFVEGYWNDWLGVPVSDKETGQIDLYILGEGKTTSFDGVLSINCESASGYFWKTGSFWDKPAVEYDYNNNMPLEVISNARKLFC